MLVVKDIYKTYENQPLLEGVSFEVYPGEIVCLLGPSGSGKSTLLRIIAGLETPEKGSVLWNDEVIDQVPTHQRQFGLMFQDYALFPHRNVAQNVSFGLRMLKMDPAQIKNRSAEVLDLVSMLSFADRKVTDLSGGEQQRVALARALAPGPRLIMLDEPLGALDKSLKAELGINLRKILHKSGIPVIYVTHDQEEAFAIADRLLILHEGRIIQSGTPEDIYAQPQNAWVASFFGLGNLLEVKNIDQQAGLVETGSGSFRPQALPKENYGQDRFQLLLRASDGVLVSENHASENTIPGRVTECRFQGNNYRLVIQSMDQKEIFFFNNEPLKPGSLIRVHFPSETITCLPGEVLA
jgi:ABC-type Fe3+/spermidine/putrescine transport system ATPase subunit